MQLPSTRQELGGTVSNWHNIILPYQKADNRQAAWQVINSLVPFLTLYGLIVLAARSNYWLTFPLLILTAAFQVRLFIIFHDCGHGSFTSSHKANSIIGSILGALVYTPSQVWWHDHAVHHATSGDLDRRGTGDVSTMTVQEYLASPWYKRLGYRLFRSPLVMFGLGPYYIFGIINRLPFRKLSKKELGNLIFTDTILALKVALLIVLVGWQRTLAVELPVLFFAGTFGIWLFYVQHQFENMYWVRTEEWDYTRSALDGASFYKLPRILQWFSGNIGFHHIHHLSPRIPNYNLEKCSIEHPELKPSTILTLGESIKCAMLSLWDEEGGRLIRFKDLKQRRMDFHSIAK